VIEAGLEATVAAGLTNVIDLSVDASENGVYVTISKMLGKARSNYALQSL
jgi:hypothetical protein